MLLCLSAGDLSVWKTQSWRCALTGEDVAAAVAQFAASAGPAGPASTPSSSTFDYKMDITIQLNIL